MTMTTTISMDADKFLYSMRSRSFAFVGAAMLVRARLALEPSNRLPRTVIPELFRAKQPNAIALLDEVMDFAFREDEHGMIYSPSLDRAVSA